MSEPKRILVVDDEPEVADLVARSLQAAGYAVRTARDGTGALAALGEFAPHLLVLDVIMPGENGYRLSRKIKSAASAETPAPKVLLLTGRRLDSDPERERIFIEFSLADDLLYKPFDVPELQRRVASLVGPPC